MPIARPSKHRMSISAWSREKTVTLVLTLGNTQQSSPARLWTVLLKVVRWSRSRGGLAWKSHPE